MIELDRCSYVKGASAIVFISAILMAAFCSSSTFSGVVGGKVGSFSLRSGSTLSSLYNDESGIPGLSQVAATALNSGSPDLSNQTQTGSLVEEYWPGGCTAWQDQRNALAEDGAFVWTGDTNSSQWSSNHLRVMGFGFHVPSGATIFGVQLQVKKCAYTASGGDVMDLHLFLLRAGVSAGIDKADVVANWSSSNTWYYYGGPSDLWGISWTPDDVNDANFGAVFACAGSYALGAVDTMIIEVWYQTSPGQGLGLPDQNTIVSLSGIGVFFTLLIVAIVVLKKNRSSGRIRRPSYGPQSAFIDSIEGHAKANSGAGTVLREACPKCGAAIDVADSSYCRRCGTRLTGSIRDSSTSGRGGRRDRGSSVCMVCNLEVLPNDKTVSCPYCGGAAHETHMLEWLHVKDYCPLCYRHLDSESFR